MSPRWKGKGAEAKALAEPVSQTISMLKSSLTEAESSGFLSDLNVLLAVDPEQAKLLDRALFGRPVANAEKDKRWFQLSLEEAFFLFYDLNCIKIAVQNHCLENKVDVWQYMISRKANFPIFYKAYSHLRLKNWIVRSGLQYGVDFVAYRHHPSLVHSEYAVLVQSSSNTEGNCRLRVWSDVHCTGRLCGSVAKTLLVLYVDKDVERDDSPECLKNYTVEEQTITRWIPEQSREEEATTQKATT